MAETLRDQLTRLHELLVQEREYAKAFAMTDLMATVQAKNDLLKTLEPIHEISPEDRELAAVVREENRRNAYLFWATLGFVRESMSFFQKEMSPVSYGAHGTTIRGNHGGMLLRGRI